MRWTDLVTRLGPEFTALEFHRATGERFLTQEELLYTQMYAYGSLARTPGNSNNTLPTNPLGLQLPTVAPQLGYPQQGLAQVPNSPQTGFPTNTGRQPLPALPTLPSMGGPTSLLGGNQQSMIPTMGAGPVARSPMLALPRTTTTIVESQNMGQRTNFNLPMANQQPVNMSGFPTENQGTVADFDDEDEDEETIPVVPLQNLTVGTPTRTNPIVAPGNRLPQQNFGQQQGFPSVQSPFRTVVQQQVPQFPSVQSPRQGFPSVQSPRQNFGQQGLPQLPPVQFPQQSQQNFAQLPPVQFPQQNFGQQGLPQQRPQLPPVQLPTVPMAQLPTNPTPGTPSRVSFAQLPPPVPVPMAKLPSTSGQFAQLPPITRPPQLRLPFQPLGQLPGALINNFSVNPNIITTPVEQALQILPVIPPAFGGPNSQNQPAQGDDKYAPVTVTWYTQRPLVRIATLGDGSCFFHATLKGFYPGYQNNASFAYRSQFVAMLRRDLAFVLGMQNPSAPGQTFYQTTANGQWVNLAEQQQMGLSLTDDFGVPVDYTLTGMQRLFNSRRDVGDEVYQFVSDMLGVDIFVVRGTDRNLYVHLSTRDPNNPRRAVVIVGNGMHYEVIAVDHGPQVGFQTIFNVGDPFITALELQRPDARRQNEEELARNGTVIDREAGTNPEPDQLYEQALSPRTLQYNQEFLQNNAQQATVVPNEDQYGGQNQDQYGDRQTGRGAPGRGLGMGFGTIPDGDDEEAYTDGIDNAAWAQAVEDDIVDDAYNNNDDEDQEGPGLAGYTPYADQNQQWGNPNMGYQQ